MAEGVQRRLESVLEELDYSLKKKLFSPEEVKTIVKKRTKYEYALRKRPTRLYDFLQYIQYEFELEQLRKKRISKIGLTYKFSPLDYAGPKRLHGLMDRALLRFPGDLGLWETCLEMSQKLKSYHRTSLSLMKAIRMHPFHVPFWLKAVAWSFEHQANVLQARRLFQRAVKVNPKSLEIWVEWFKMECMEATKMYVQNETECTWEIAWFIYQQAQVQANEQFQWKCLEIAWYSPEKVLFPRLQRHLNGKKDSPLLVVLGCFAPLRFLKPSDPQFPKTLHTSFQTLQECPLNSPDVCLSILTWIIELFPKCALNEPLRTYLKQRYQHYLMVSLTLPIVPLSIYHFHFDHMTWVSKSELFKMAQSAQQAYPTDERCMKMVLQLTPSNKMDPKVTLKPFPELYRDHLIGENQQAHLSVENAMAQCQEVQPTASLVTSILKAMLPEDRIVFREMLSSTFVSDASLLFPFLDYLTDPTLGSFMEMAVQRHPRCLGWWQTYLQYMLNKDGMHATRLYLRALTYLNKEEQSKLTQIWDQLRS